MTDADVSVSGVEDVVRIVLEPRRCWCPCRVLVPRDSRALQIWETFMQLLLLLVIVATPYDAAFGVLRLDAMFCFNRLVEVGFLLDMCGKFFTAVPHPVKRGCWVTDPRDIATSYFRGFFLIDLISVLSLPLDTIALLCNRGGGDDYSWLSLCRVARLLRVSSALGHGRVEQMQTYLGINYWKLEMLKLFFILSVACHWSACVWGRNVVGQNVETPNWLLAIENAKGGDESLYAERHNIYMLSLYWAVMTITTIGYGDITPQNRTEYLTCMAMHGCMAAVWTYVIGKTMCILSSLSPHLMGHLRRTDDMNWLLDEYDVPEENRDRIRRYLLECRDAVRHEKDKKMVGLISSTMQGELWNAVNRGWLEKVKYLRNCGPREVADIACKLETKMFAPEETEHFEMTLCIVVRGSVWRKGRVHTRSDIWGLDMVLQNRVLRDKAPSKAMSYLQLLTLRWLDLDAVARSYQSLQRSIRVARVQFAVLRGVALISRTLKVLHKGGAIDLHALSKRQFFLLSDAACLGKITPDMSRAELDEQTGLDGPPPPQKPPRAGQNRLRSQSRPRLAGMQSSTSSLSNIMSSESFDQPEWTSTISQEARSDVRTHAAEISIRMAAMTSDIRDFLTVSMGRATEQPREEEEFRRATSPKDRRSRRLSAIVESGLRRVTRAVSPSRQSPALADVAEEPERQEGRVERGGAGKGCVPPARVPVPAWQYPHPRCTD